MIPLKNVQRKLSRISGRVNMRIEGSGANRKIHLYVQHVGAEIADINDPTLWTPAPAPEHSRPGTYVPGKGLLCVHWRRGTPDDWTLNLPRNADAKSADHNRENGVGAGEKPS